MAKRPGKSRARLEPDGRLILINEDEDLEEYDWDGRLLTRYLMPEGSRAHHDLIRSENGKYPNPRALECRLCARQPQWSTR